MSILIDRLCGYDVDDTTGKTKLAIHGYIDALTDNLSATNHEMQSILRLGETFPAVVTKARVLLMLGI